MRNKLLSPFTVLCAVGFMAWVSYSLARSPLLPLFTNSLGADFYVLLLVVALYGLGVAITDSSTTAMIADISKSRNFGAAMGVQGTILDIGHASGPILAGIMVKYYSYNAAFNLAAAMLVFAAVLFTVTINDKRENKDRLGVMQKDEAYEMDNAGL